MNTTVVPRDCISGWWRELLDGRYCAAIFSAILASLRHAALEWERVLVPEDCGVKSTRVNGKPGMVTSHECEQIVAYQYTLSQRLGWFRRNLWRIGYWGRWWYKVIFPKMGKGVHVPKNPTTPIISWPYKNGWCARMLARAIGENKKEDLKIWT